MKVYLSAQLSLSSTMVIQSSTWTRALSCLVFATLLVTNALQLLTERN